MNDANQAVHKASNALDAAQQAAQNGVQLQQDAQSESKNAEARYTVLVAKSGELVPPEIARLRDEHTKLQGDLLGIDLEIQQAAQDERNESQATRTIEEFSGVAQEWMTRAADAVLVIRECAAMVEEARPRPPTPARWRHIGDRLSECHVSFSEQIEAVISSYDLLQAAMAAISLASSRQERLSGLIAKKQSTEEELTRVRSTLAEKDQTVDPALVRYVTEEHAVAEQAAKEAPNVMQRTQAAASESAAQLASAQEWQKQARQNFDNVESKIITAIDVSKPNAAGWVKATAHLAQKLSPLLYKLHWEAGGADVRNVQEAGGTGLTETVLIDTNMLPLGDTAVTASIVQAPKP
ncbi:MAG: hypothetical protein ACLP5E_24160 [Streptosporangiaceae bacterium]